MTTLPAPQTPSTPQLSSSGPTSQPHQEEPVQLGWTHLSEEEQGIAKARACTSIVGFGPFLGPVPVKRPGSSVTRT